MNVILLAIFFVRKCLDLCAEDTNWATGQVLEAQDGTSSSTGSCLQSLLGYQFMLRKIKATNKITQGQTPLCWMKRRITGAFTGGWNLPLHWTPAGLAEKLWQFKQVLNSSSVFYTSQQINSCGSGSSAQKLRTPHRTHRYLWALTSNLTSPFCVWDPSLSSTTTPQTAPGPAASMLLSPHLLHYPELFCFYQNVTM